MWLKLELPGERPPDLQQVEVVFLNPQQKETSALLLKTNDVVS